MTQIQELYQELLKGRRLGQIEMLNELGIGNHTGRICDLRQKLIQEGKPLDYISTEMVSVKKRNGKTACVAVYFIPSKYLTNE